MNSEGNFDFLNEESDDEVRTDKTDKVLELSEDEADYNKKQFKYLSDQLEAIQKNQKKLELLYQEINNKKSKKKKEKNKTKQVSEVIEQPKNEKFDRRVFEQYRIRNSEFDQKIEFTDAYLFPDCNRYYKPASLLQTNKVNYENIPDARTNAKYVRDIGIINQEDQINKMQLGYHQKHYYDPESNEIWYPLSYWFRSSE